MYVSTQARRHIDHTIKYDTQHRFPNESYAVVVYETTFKTEFVLGMTGSNDLALLAKAYIVSTEKQLPVKRYTVYFLDKYNEVRRRGGTSWIRNLSCNVLSIWR